MLFDALIYKCRRLFFILLTVYILGKLGVFWFLIAVILGIYIKKIFL